MERKRKVQTQEEWEEEMTYKIYRFVHDELYIEFRYLDIALGFCFPKQTKEYRPLQQTVSGCICQQSRCFACFKKILPI